MRSLVVVRCCIVAGAACLALFTPAGIGRAAAAQDPAPAAAGARPRYQVPRASSEIKVDGHLDEGAWRDALVLQLGVELEPTPNAKPPVSTTVYIAYDEKNLYAAFRADDPDPASIRARLTDRDGAEEDDFVGLGLDTFNDERQGFLFYVNPLGVQMDSSRTEVGSEEEDEAWDAIWSSAGRIDGQGYTVEIAIPFTSLRFQRAAGDQTWGVMPIRNYPRSERHQIVAVPVDKDNNCIFCQAAKMTGFSGAKPGINLEVTPTLTARRTEARETVTGPLEERDSKVDPGVTARWGITPNLVFSGTVNPDFSQVEADSAQLDVNTQFALFFPEKRPFFLEGTDVFDTPFNAVYTRTVADPSWGVKLTGKEGKNGIGVFVAEDETTNLLLPFSQFSRRRTLEQDTLDAVLRYRRDVGSSSTVGALLTQREGEDYSNRVAGVDAVYRPTSTDRINVNYLDSSTEYPAEFVAALAEDGIVVPRGTFDGQAWRVSYTHDSRNWQWYGRADEVDRGFRADLGFMPRVGYEVQLAGLERRFWAKEGDWYTQIRVGGDWDSTSDVDGQLLEEELEMWVELVGPLQSFYSIDTGRRDKFWNGRLFDQRFTNFAFSIRPTGQLYFSLDGTVGDDIDFDHTRSGKELRLAPEIELNLGQHLQLELEHTYQRLKVDGGTLFEANLTQFEAVYQLNVRTFVQAILQYTDIQNDQNLYAFEVDEQQEDLFTQLLFSYKLNPQTVLFLGYSDAALGTQDVNLIRQNRTLFFKVGYALVL